MINTDLNKKLNQLKNEDFIWIIYLGIIALSFYSNHLEREYFLKKNPNDKERYQQNMILIFSILIIVYLYFLKDAFEDFKNLSPNDSYKRKKLITLSFIASLLIAISGFIFLYIALVDDDLQVELAFN